MVDKVICSRKKSKSCREAEALFRKNQSHGAQSGRKTGFKSISMRSVTGDDRQTPEWNPGLKHLTRRSYPQGVRGSQASGIEPHEAMRG